MCGIAGRAGPRGSWVPDQALAALAHRGPDAAGVDELQTGDWSCAVAHTRLAINDLSASGDQPLYNEAETLALVFNGEIYNSPELRRHCEAKGHTFRSRSDGEVILHLWEDEGPAALRRLNGIFAFALQDRRDGTLVLVRDPLGVKPLFWSADRESLWFASELQALKATGAPLGSPDVVALAQFLTFLWIPDPRTPYSGGHSLPPGTMLTWRAGTHRLERYADLMADSAAAPTLTLEVAEREFRGRFKRPCGARCCRTFRWASWPREGSTAASCGGLPRTSSPRPTRSTGRWNPVGRGCTKTPKPSGSWRRIWGPPSVTCPGRRSMSRPCRGVAISSPTQQ